MLKSMVAAASAAAMLTAPCAAAELPAFREAGTPQRGAFAGAYVKIPLSGPRGKAAPHAGLRLSMVQDYRDNGGARIGLVSRDAVDLRFGAGSKPALYLAGTPVTGRSPERLHGLDTGETVAIVAGAVVLAGVVGLLVLRSELAEDE